jgi:homoserine acetyltransferase
VSEYIEHDARGISVGIVEKKTFTFAEPPDEMRLESGARLGPVTLAYETYGELNAQRDNAVLVMHALTGDSHAAGYYADSDDKPGWWDIMVGPGKGLDTDRYFVICSNIIGSCMGSTGPCTVNPKTVKAYGLDYPVVTIGDMVSAQKALIDHLGIEKLLCVVGGSIGGMQVLEWCVRYPERVVAAIPLATTMKHSALAIAFNEVARQAIMADPKWNNGNYDVDAKPETGLAVARMIGHITYPTRPCALNSDGGSRTKAIFLSISTPISRSKAICATRAKSSSTDSMPTPFYTSPRRPTTTISRNSMETGLPSRHFPKRRPNFWSSRSPPTGSTRLINPGKSSKP